MVTCLIRLLKVDWVSSPKQLYPNGYGGSNLTISLVNHVLIRWTEQLNRSQRTFRYRKMLQWHEEPVVTDVSETQMNSPAINN